MSQDNSNIIRLNKLMRRGYKINEGASQDVVDCLWLEHPAKARLKWPELIMYSDGLLVSHSIGDEENQLRISNGENEKFINFISTVPEPNIWEKTASFRTNITAWFILLILWGVGAALFNIIFNIFSNGT